MGRLIDADKLKKDIAKLHVLHDEKEIRRLYYANPHTSLADFEEILVRVFDAIEAAPTIDAVEVVRCKECRYKDMKLCAMYKLVVAGVRKYDDFCSLGEREETDHE